MQKENKLGIDFTYIIIFAGIIFLAIFLSFEFSNIPLVHSVFYFSSAIALLMLFFFPAEFLGLWFTGLYCIIRTFDPFDLTFKYTFTAGICVFLFIVKNRINIFPRISNLMIINSIFMLLYYFIGIFSTAPEVAYKVRDVFALNYLVFILIIYFSYNEQSLKKVFYAMILGSVFLALSGYISLIFKFNYYHGGFAIGGFGGATVLFGRICAEASILLTSIIIFKKYNYFYGLKKIPIIILNILEEFVPVLK